MLCVNTSFCEFDSNRCRSRDAQVTVVEVQLGEAQAALLRQLARDQGALLQGGAAFLGAVVTGSGLFAVGPVAAAVQASNCEEAA